MRFLVGFLAIFCGFLFSANLLAEDAPPSFTLSTNAFMDEMVIPVLYTCDGKNISPQLSWTNAPAKTKTFALIFSDSDAPGGTFYHWMFFNLPSSTKELAEGVDKLPAGTLLGKNSTGKDNYSGPCPPKGSSHTYIFNFYALDTKLSLAAGADAKDLQAAMKGHILKETKLTTVYSRWFK